MNSGTLDIQHTFIRKFPIICGIGKNGSFRQKQTEVHHEQDTQESNHDHHGCGNTRHRAFRLLPVQAEQDQRLLMRSRLLHRLWPNDPEMTHSSWTRTLRVHEHKPLCKSPLRALKATLRIAIGCFAISISRGRSLKPPLRVAVSCLSVAIGRSRTHVASLRVAVSCSPVAVS